MHSKYHLMRENIETDAKEIECEGLGWIQLAHCRDQWRAVLGAVVNTGGSSIIFRRRILALWS